MNGQPGSIFHHLLPGVADLLALALYIWLLPKLTARLQEREVGNAALVTAIYLFFCLGVFLIRKLPGGAGTVHPVLVIGGVFFAFLVAFMADDSSGGFANLEVDLDSLSGSMRMFLAVTAFFALIFLYPAILWIDVEPGNFQGVAAALIRFFGLIAINVMIILSIAHWQAYFGDVQPYENLSWAAKLVIFLVTYAFFLLFYASPRLIYLIKNPSWVAVGTFLLQTGYYIWNSLVRRAW